MGKGYDNDETGQLVLELETLPIVYRPSAIVAKWLFRRLKGFCRIFSKFDKLNFVFMFFNSFHTDL